MADADINSRLTPELERTLRRYVLGRVEENLRMEIDELLITDPEVFEALGVVEDELIEEYLDGVLQGGERGAFDEHFLTSEQRRARLGFSRSLRARASSQSTATSARRLRMDTGRRATWTPASIGLAAALVLSIAGNLWFASRDLGGGAGAGHTPPADDSPSTRPASVETLTLAPGMLRSGGSLTRLTVRAGTLVVRLRLELAGDDYTQYQATILDDRGREVWTGPKLQATKEGSSVAVLVDVPAGVLSRGDYELRLSGSTDKGETEIVGTYVFRADVS